MATRAEVVGQHETRGCRGGFGKVVVVGAPRVRGAGVGCPPLVRITATEVVIAELPVQIHTPRLALILAAVHIDAAGNGAGGRPPWRAVVRGVGAAGSRRTDVSGVSGVDAG